MSPPRRSGGSSRRSEHQYGRDGNGGDEPIKSYGTILDQEIGVATQELDRSLPALVASGVEAGLTLGTTLLLLLVMESTLGEAAHPLLQRALVGNAYAIGFALVIFSRADLFTEYTTIAVLPVLVGRASVASLARLWSVIYVSNLLGGLAIAAFLVYLVGGLAWLEPVAFGRLGYDLTQADAMTMVLSGTFAGWLMGLLSWLVVAAHETVSQVLFVWMVGMVIGLGGLHHSITGAIEVFAAVIAHGALGLGDAVHFLLWVTLGNVVGSLLFAVAVRVGVIRGGRSD